MDSIDDKEFSGSVLSLFEYGKAFVKTNSRKMWHKLPSRRVDFPEYPERRGSGIGKILDAYALQFSNPCGRKPQFVSDSFFRTILPNLTYGLTKEELVSFAEEQSTPNSRPYKSTVQVNRTSQPYKSTIQVARELSQLLKAVQG